MAGFADSPFALTPFGTGTPAEANPPPTRRIPGARYVNPSTRDYQLDDENELARMPTVRQQMLLAVTTLLESSAVEPGRGIKLPEKIDENFSSRVRVSVERATAEIVSSGRATVDNVRTEILQTGRALILISYTDLTTGEQGVLIV